MPIVLKDEKNKKRQCKVSFFFHVDIRSIIEVSNLIRNRNEFSKKKKKKKKRTVLVRPRVKNTGIPKRNQVYFRERKKVNLKL